MDVLVIDDYILYKQDQPKHKDQEYWQTQIDLD